MSSSASVSFTVQVLFDISCPWCFIGKRRLEKALKQRPRLDVDFSWKALLLAPALPRRGVDYQWYMEQRLQGPANVRAVQNDLVSMAREIGIDLAFERIRTLPNTFAAHALITLATEAGCADEMVDALFHAYLCEGCDIGNEGVLLDIAERYGLAAAHTSTFLHNPLSRAITLSQNRQSRSSGCRGVPSFIFDNRLILTGAQDLPAFVHMLDATVETRSMAFHPLEPTPEDDASRL